MKRKTELNEDQILTWYIEEGRGLVEIGKQLRTSHRTIRNILQKHDVTIRPGGPPVLEKDISVARTMYEQGIPFKTIAKALHKWPLKLKQIA